MNLKEKNDALLAKLSPEERASFDRCIALQEKLQAVILAGYDDGKGKYADHEIKTAVASMVCKIAAFCPEIIMAIGTGISARVYAHDLIPKESIT